MIVYANVFYIIAWFCYTYYRSDFNTQIKQNKILGVVDDNITTDMDRISSQIMDTVAPYSRFVRIETTKVEHLNIEFAKIRTDIRTIQDKIERI